VRYCGHDRTRPYAADAEHSGEEQASARIPDRGHFIAERAFESLDCGVFEDPEAVRAFLSNGFIAFGGRRPRLDRQVRSANGEVPMIGFFCCKLLISI
jgi:hypothetical protein